MAKKQTKDIHLFIFSVVAMFIISVTLITMINIITINIDDNNYVSDVSQTNIIANTNSEETPPHDLLIVPASEIKAKSN